MVAVNEHELHALNESLTGAEPLAILQAAFKIAPARPIATSNFRPYEAVVLHLAQQIKADIPVLWVDHGTNLPETYRFADACLKQMHINLKPYLPRMSSAHWLALNGESIPMPDEVARVEAFSETLKLEPFERGMRELAPTLWITALRREQNPQRAATLKPLQWDDKFQCLKVNPLLDWTQAQLQAYVEMHQLPNERAYYDPAKGSESHECGLHAALTTR
jgi:phosphoadenosine phosphosulfate reductase